MAAEEKSAGQQLFENVRNHPQMKVFGGLVSTLLAKELKNLGNGVQRKLSALASLSGKSASERQAICDLVMRGVANIVVEKIVTPICGSITDPAQIG